jgi:hypothetical protein
MKNSFNLFLNFNLIKKTFELEKQLHKKNTFYKGLPQGIS